MDLIVTRVGTRICCYLVFRVSIADFCHLVLLPGLTPALSSGLSPGVFVRDDTVLQ
jgi:hypothetical protein